MKQMSENLSGAPAHISPHLQSFPVPVLPTLAWGCESRLPSSSSDLRVSFRASTASVGAPNERRTLHIVLEQLCSELEICKLRLSM